MSDPCDCHIWAETGTCSHADRGLWDELHNTPPATETHTDTDQAVALATHHAEQVVDLLIASAADDPRMPAILAFHHIPEWVLPAALACAVNRLVAL